MIANNLKTILENIKSTCELVNRDVSEIKIIAVSKKQGKDKISEAISEGVLCFGENYAQELEEKFEYFKDKNIQWHFIGPLQKNKVKKVVGIVDYIHSVHNLSLAQMISKIAKNKDITQKILIQINIANEPTKSGFDPLDLENMIDEIQSLPHIKICGLMCMPPIYDNFENSQRDFRKAFEFSKKLEKKLNGAHHMKELSMGTSHDYTAAIKEGATMLRLGTVLLGERQY